jgi:hypothetical protein
MEAEAFKHYVENRYEPQMKYYSGASAKNQLIYKRYQMVLIILSAVTPVLAALKGIKIKFIDSGNSLDLNVLVLVVSSIVAILTTILKTFNYQELWIISRTTLEKLKPEKYYYEGSVGPYGESGVDKEALFVTRIETILGAEHGQWPPAKNLDNPQK